MVLEALRDRGRLGQSVPFFTERRKKIGPVTSPMLSQLEGMGAHSMLSGG